MALGSSQHSQLRQAVLAQETGRAVVVEPMADWPGPTVQVGGLSAGNQSYVTTNDRAPRTGHQS